MQVPELVQNDGSLDDADELNIRDRNDPTGSRSKMVALAARLKSGSSLTLACNSVLILRQKIAYHVMMRRSRVRVNVIASNIPFKSNAPKLCTP
jgi:hypothetical protein